MKQFIAVFVLFCSTSTLSAKDDIFVKLESDIRDLLAIEQVANDLCMNIPTAVFADRKIMQSCKDLLFHAKAIKARHKDD